MYKASIAVKSPELKFKLFVAPEVPSLTNLSLPQPAPCVSLRSSILELQK